MTQSRTQALSAIRALQDGTTGIGDLTAANTQRLPKLSEQNAMIQRLKQLDLPDKLLVFALIESLDDKRLLRLDYQRDIKLGIQSE